MLLMYLCALLKAELLLIHFPVSQGKKDDVRITYRAVGQVYCCDC